MNYYEILEVSEKASDEVIKMAYKALVKKYHPDTFNGDPKIAEEKMKEINAAYFILSNTEKRREYDAFLHFQRNQTNQNNYTTQTNSNRTQAPSSPNKSAANFDTLIARITPIIFILAIPLAYNFFASYYALPPLFSPTPTPSPTPTYVAPNPPLPSNLIPDYNIVVNESDGLDFFEKVELRKAELIKEGNYKLPAEMVQPFSNGQMIISPTENCVCPLSVSVSGDDAYYIYLESLSGKSDLAFMIKPDSMVEIDVPLGKFEMYYATGKSWYGTTLKFGDETRYYKAGTTLEFTRDGQYYYGHEIELWEQYDGNMTEIDIKESDFPG